MAVLFPVLSKVQNDLPRFQNIVIKTLGIISFIVFFLLGVMYLISEELIVLLFSEKWLPSVAYFKILLLSGFAYPISALLVDSLTSRGNSKAFLRLEIYKKILLSINFYVGFSWGIEGYLYGLVLVAISSVSLNILFVAREIKLSFLLFLKPIIIQMIISLVAVMIVNLLISEDYGILLSILIKSISFTFIYAVINIFLKTSSYINIRKEVIQILERRKRVE